MEDKNGKYTLMVLITALGGLAIVVLIGWAFFFNPLDTMEGTEKPELTLSSIEEADQSYLLPEKSTDELLIDGIQNGDEVPLLIEEGEDEIIITMEETVAEEESSVEEAVPAVLVQPEPEPVPEPAKEQVTYKQVTQAIYWLQVGSFPNSNKAEALRTSLKDRGIDSVMQTRTVNGTLYYRVRVGAYYSKSEAEAFKSQLLSLDDISEVTLYTDSITKTVVVD
ncbi:MAG: SPOR domain-containing protein [Spirochaetales bacterium]|nr:SPOR domain-containing protein [Spirochaetales bacterium]